MARKISVLIILVLCVSASAFAAVYDVSYEEVTDDRVIAFADYYMGGFSPEEYAEQVDIIDGIYFEYDDDLEYYTVYIIYSDGNVAVIDFMPYQAELFYVDWINVPASKTTDALKKMNEYQCRDYETALGTLILEDGLLGARHIILTDGVSDYGEWAFWNFAFFEAYSRNAIDEILMSLGLKTTSIWQL